jgi:hypothetical protein
VIKFSILKIYFAWNGNHSCGKSLPNSGQDKKRKIQEFPLIRIQKIKVYKRPSTIELEK